jgi:hypothetical protein
MASISSGDSGFDLDSDWLAGYQLAILFIEIVPHFGPWV